MAKKKDYEVGYGRPPKKSQFRKGQSGNPSGRPKKVLTHEEIVVRELNRKFTIQVDGKNKRISRLEGIIKRQALLATQGDPKAVRFLVDAYNEAVRNKAAEQGDDEQKMVVTLVFDEEDERRRQIEEENRQWRLESGDDPEEF